MNRTCRQQHLISFVAAMPILKPIIITILLSLMTCLLQAQKPRQYTFTHYTGSSGLVSNQVNSVIQDEEGYIWIATTDGLQRFDGIRYKTFRHKEGDESSIPSNTIVQMMLDKKNNLWLLMVNGEAGIFDKKRFVFHKSMVQTKNEVALSAWVKQMIQDEDGNLFILFGGNELLSWNESKNIFSAGNNFFTAPPGLHINSLARQPGTKKYWMALKEGGIAIYDHEKNLLSYQGNNAGNEIAVPLLANVPSPGNLHFDKKGRVWFDGWENNTAYVYCYDLKMNEFILNKYSFHAIIKTYYETRGFFEQKDGTIWVKGSQVFARYLEKEKLFEPVFNGYVNERGIAFRVINNLSEDKEMNIWVGTGNNGIFRFNPLAEYFSNITHIDRKTGLEGDGSPIAFIETKNETILVGMWGDGLYRYDKNFNEIPLSIKGIPDNNVKPVWDFCYANDSNTIWMSAQPGIYSYDQHNGAAIFYNPAALQNETVREIAEDKNSNLWLGMQTLGVFKWNVAKGKTKFEDGLSQFPPIPPSRINVITVDSKGLVWIGTSGEGAYVVNASSDMVVKHFDIDSKIEERIPEGTVFAFLEYNDSLMIIGTSTRLLIYNRNTKTILPLGNAETTSGTISSIEKDSNGNLWVSTTSALYKINIHTKAFLRFNRDDGIANDYFVLSSSFVLPDGRMLFGSSAQFSVFDPKLLMPSTSFPDVTITDIKVMNQSIRPDSLTGIKRLELGANNNSIAVEFSSLRYSGAFLFQYKLDGLDKDWKTADQTNQAIYSYLPSGEYTLRFKILNADGQNKEADTKLFIKINPPFWRTWWFYSLIILCAMVLLYWFDRERIKRKVTIQAMRSNIAGSLQEQLSTDLSTINVLSEMARMKADNEPEKSKEFIEQIRDKSSTIIDAVDDMFWSISPENDSMQKAIARVREYIDGLNNRFNAAIELLVDDNTKLLNLDMQFRYESFQLFKESIEGLLKAGAKECKIHIAPDKTNLVYSIQFANDGCDMQQLTNLLQSQRIAKRLEIIKAAIHTDIKKSVSLLMLKIPFSK